MAVSFLQILLRYFVWMKKAVLRPSFNDHIADGESIIHRNRFVDVIKFKGLIEKSSLSKSPQKFQNDIFSHDRRKKFSLQIDTHCFRRFEPCPARHEGIEDICRTHSRCQTSEGSRCSGMGIGSED